MEGKWAGRQVGRRIDMIHSHSNPTEMICFSTIRMNNNVWLFTMFRHQTNSPHVQQYFEYRTAMWLRRYTKATHGFMVPVLPGNFHILRTQQNIRVWRQTLLARWSFNKNICNIFSISHIGTWYIDYRFCHINYSVCRFSITHCMWLTCLFNL